MATRHIAPLWLALLTLPAASADAADAGSSLEHEAHSVAARFAATLKPRLLAAIEHGGPVHAVAVCAEEAPAIAARLSVESGWNVRRVSLKPRNPRALPDDWEGRGLEEFDALVAAGGVPAATSATVDGEFRLLVPQLTAPLCLTCHGTPAGDLASTLAQHYPDDQATGYEPGQVRGAISVRRVLQE